MLTLPPAVQIYLAVDPVDLRAAFDGLSALVRHGMGRNPLDGHLYVFLNRRANRVKILWFDRNGFALLYKRLERGQFRVPRAAAAGASHAEIESAELALMLEGIDLRDAKRTQRWKAGSERLIFDKTHGFTVEKTMNV